MLPKTYDLDLLLRQLSVDAKWDRVKLTVIRRLLTTCEQFEQMVRYNHTTGRFGPTEEEK